MRTVFIVSDGTAITAEVMGQAVLSQFPFEFELITLPFVNSPERLSYVGERIRAVLEGGGEPPLVFHSIARQELRQRLAAFPCRSFDLLNAFLAPLEAELGVRAVPKPHRAHSSLSQHYFERIEAVNYTMTNDDGISLKQLDQADLILVGVSRCGKTPTSLYLAMQFGLKVANYPFIPEDLEQLAFPPELMANRSRVYGLTIDPLRLHEIRSQRRAGSRYADLRQCRLEVQSVERLLRRLQIPTLNTTSHSVEELAAQLLEMAGLNRRVF